MIILDSIRNNKKNILIAVAILTIFVTCMIIIHPIGEKAIRLSYCLIPNSIWKWTYLSYGIQHPPCSEPGLDGLTVGNLLEHYPNLNENMKHNFLTCVKANAKRNSNYSIPGCTECWIRNMAVCAMEKGLTFPLKYVIVYHQYYLDSTFLQGGKENISEHHHH